MSNVSTLTTYLEKRLNAKGIKLEKCHNRWPSMRFDSIKVISILFYASRFTNQAYGDKLSEMFDAKKKPKKTNVIFDEDISVGK